MAHTYSLVPFMSLDVWKPVKKKRVNHEKFLRTHLLALTNDIQQQQRVAAAAHEKELVSVWSVCKAVASSDSDDRGSMGCLAFWPAACWSQELPVQM